MANLSNQSRRFTWFLIIILLIAFTLRFTFFLQMAKSPIADMVIEDSKTYNDWARAIARGDWRGSEVFYALPLYPYFLGLIYSIFGYHLQLAKFIQVILGTLNCYLLFRLGRFLFHPIVGLLASFFMAVYGWLVVYDSAILSPVLIIFLNLSVLLYLLSAEKKKRGWPTWLGGGLLVGLTSTASAHILLFVPAVFIWAISLFPSGAGKQKWLSATSFLLGVVLIIGGITTRNWLVGDDFVPLTAHGGINFFIGNNPHSRGVFEPPPILRSGGATLRDDSEKIAQRSLGRRLKPSEVSSYWFGQGLAFIKQQPARFLELLGKKFIIFWDGLEIADVIHPYFFRDFAPVLRFPFLVFPIIAPVALLGIGLSWRIRRRLLLLYLFLATYIFSTMFYFVNSRYRLPLVPLLLLFAGYSVFWWWEKGRRKEFHLLLISLSILIILIIFVNPGLVSKPRLVLNLGAGHNHLGTYYSEKGDLELARQEFEKALRLEPYRAEAHYNLANIHLKLKQYSQALRGYREAVRINPFYETAHLALGFTYEQLGENEAAYKKYLEIIQNLPHNPQGYLRLARLLLLQEKIDEAIRVLQKSISVNPQEPLLYAQLALAYGKKGDFNQAQSALEKGLQHSPEDGRLHLELARIFIQSLPDPEKALLHLEIAVRQMPDNFLIHLYLGDLYYRMGRREEALKEWEAARAIKPGDKMVAERLSQAIR